VIKGASRWLEAFAAPALIQSPATAMARPERFSKVFIPFSSSIVGVAKGVTERLEKRMQFSPKKIESVLSGSRLT